MLRNNYRSRNLIGHYPFWVISPRNLTSFTRPFLAGRRARAGHETIPDPPSFFLSLIFRRGVVAEGLGTRLDYVAVNSYNTLRYVKSDPDPDPATVQLMSRDYIRSASMVHCMTGGGTQGF